MPSEEDLQKSGKYFAIEANNAFWKISETDLDGEGKKETLKLAFTSLYHWEMVGNEENKYLAYTAVARALTINNLSDIALSYAKEAHEFFQSTEESWIKAFTNAILSHALLIAGEADASAKHYKIASEIGISLPEGDKEVFDATFNRIPKPH